MINKQSIFNKLHDVKKHLILYALMLCFIFISIVFGVYPIIQSIYMSFFKTNTIFTKPVFLGLANYLNTFKDPAFWNSFKITTLFTVISVPLNLVVSLLLAQALYYKGIKKFQLIFKLAIFIPFITPDVVGAIVWKQFFNSSGAFNSMLLALNLQPQEWLTNGTLAFWVLVFVELWKHVGLYTIIFLTNYQYIDTEIYEASYIDGAGAFARYFYITLPSLKPAFTLNFLYALIQFLKTYTVSRIITFGGPNFATNFLSYHAYQKYEKMDFGQSTTIASILFVFIIFISIIGSKLGGDKNEE